MYFPVSGVEVSPLWPCATAFAISLCCSTAGISGAFLLLPYQISVLGYVQPGVSATNQLFNILACPAGVWRYAREGRLLLPLALFIAAGTLPGVFIGALLRLTVLAMPRRFLIFIAFVLVYIGLRLFFKKVSRSRFAPCRVLSASLYGFRFECSERIYELASWPLVSLSFVVGIVGGAYGVGGGAIMAPFLVAWFDLPVYAIAGATLLATFLTSLAGVAFYALLAVIWAAPWAAPDWALGLLLGAGGIAGMYCGACLQKYLPARALRFFIVALILIMAVHYLIEALAA